MKVELNSKTAQMLLDAMQDEIEALRERVSELEADLVSEWEKNGAIVEFVIERKELIPSLAEFVYSTWPKQAKSIVAPYHDETMDLSTIACCRHDFEPWNVRT